MPLQERKEQPEAVLWGYYNITLLQTGDGRVLLDVLVRLLLVLPLDVLVALELGHQ